MMQPREPLGQPPTVQAADVRIEPAPQHRISHTLEGLPPQTLRTSMSHISTTIPEQGKITSVDVRAGPEPQLPQLLSEALDQRRRPKRRRKQLAKDAMHPKRAKTAFMFFSIATRPSLVQENPHIAFTDVGCPVIPAATNDTISVTAAPSAPEASPS